MQLDALNLTACGDDFLKEYYELSPSTDPQVERLAEKRLEQVLRKLDPQIIRILRHKGYPIEELVSLAHERLILAIRKSREEQSPIKCLPAYTSTIVTNLIIDEERKYSPRRQMALRIQHVVTYPKYQEHLAHWKYANVLTMIGLRAWEGRGLAATENYYLFCREHDVFVDHCVTVLAAIPGRPAIVHLRDARFPEVVIVFFQWIKTPLEMGQMVDDFLKILPIKVPPVGPLNNQVAQPVDPTTYIDWEPVWKCILTIPVNTRRVFILGMDPKMLRILTGKLNLIPVITAALEYTDQTFEQYVYDRMPLDDSEIAKQLGIRVNNVHVMRKRARDRIRTEFPHLPMV